VRRPRLGGGSYRQGRSLVRDDQLRPQPWANIFSRSPVNAGVVAVLQQAECERSIIADDRRNVPFVVSFSDLVVRIQYTANRWTLRRVTRAAGAADGPICSDRGCEVTPRVDAKRRMYVARVARQCGNSELE